MSLTSIQRRYVTSSNIAAIGYSAPDQVLEVEFTTGDVYRYYAVPAETFDEIMHAPSKGRCFHERIRGRFRYAKT